MLDLTERRLAEGLTEIEVDGELDLSVADQLQEAIDQAGPGTTLIDLRHCTFIDSTGIAVILRAHRKRRDEGGRVVVHSLSSPAQRLFTVTGLIDDGLVFADRDQASEAAQGDQSN
jgi:stage II sporulation protein AA (anti-sigma F factor antagonist)